MTRRPFLSVRSTGFGKFTARGAAGGRGVADGERLAAVRLALAQLIGDELVDGLVKLGLRDRLVLHPLYLGEQRALDVRGLLVAREYRAEDEDAGVLA